MFSVQCSACIQVYTFPIFEELEPQIEELRSKSIKQRLSKKQIFLSMHDHDHRN